MRQMKRQMKSTLPEAQKRSRRPPAVQTQQRQMCSSGSATLVDNKCTLTQTHINITVFITFFFFFFCNFYYFLLWKISASCLSNEQRRQQQPWWPTTWPHSHSAFSHFNYLKGKYCAQCNKNNATGHQLKLLWFRVTAQICNANAHTHTHAVTFVPLVWLHSQQTRLPPLCGRTTTPPWPPWRVANPYTPHHTFPIH